MISKQKKKWIKEWLENEPSGLCPFSKSPLWDRLNEKRAIAIYCLSVCKHTFPGLKWRKLQIIGGRVCRVFECPCLHYKLPTVIRRAKELVK